MHLLALIFKHLRLISTVEEFPFEELDTNNSEYKLEQVVYNQDVYDIL